MRLPPAERLVFLASVVALAFLYGYGARYFGWFPDAFLSRAASEARKLVSPPTFVSPRAHGESGARMVDSAAVQPGMTLVASVWRDPDGVPALRLLEPDGSVAHQWVIDPSEIFPDQFSPLAIRHEVDPVHGAQLLEEGHLLVNVPYVGTARLDACGRPVWRLAVGSHHSIDRAPDGSFWIVGRRGTLAPHPIWEWDPPGPVVHDLMIKVGADGRVRRTIDVLDVLDADDSLVAHVFRHQPVDDVTHLNDVEALEPSLAGEYPLFEAGDLLVSLKHLNLVVVFDPETLEIRWRATGPFIQQHDPDFIGGGWIGIFDNREDGTYRGTRLGGSRILAIEPHTDSTRVLFPGPASDPFHTPNMGKWQLLENGNLLVTESRAGRVLEVTPEGRTVWEWVTTPYNSASVAEVSEGTRYDLTPEEVAAWPCSPGGFGGTT